MVKRALYREGGGGLDKNTNDHKSPLHFGFEVAGCEGT